MDITRKYARDVAEEIASYLERKQALDTTVLLSADGDKTVTRLSVEKVDNDQGYMTLLSEGSILYRDGSIRLYITKGTIKKWYDSIDENFEGYVTTGHVDINSTPIREGYFRKEHLKLQVDENGRTDLLVKPVVNTELSTIQDLIKQNEPFAISSEFFYTDKELNDSELVEYAKLVLHNKSVGVEVADIPITDNINITGFSFVGNPGNAKSGGYDPQILLGNEDNRVKSQIIDAMLAKLSGEDKPEVTVEEPTVEEPVVEPTVEEPTVEDTVEKTTEEELIEKATLRIEELEKENEALKQANAELTEYKLAKEEQDKKDEAKLAKLQSLLSKAEVTQPVEKEEPKRVNNIFGRERFGGEN